MKRMSTRNLTIKRETLRQLSGIELRGRVHGGQINSITGCAPCHPSDTIPGHCNTAEACPDTDRDTGCTITVGA